MEEQIIFYFALAAGMLLFLSMVGMGRDVGDIAMEGEAKALIKNLQDTVQQLKSSPANSYAEADIKLPEKMGTKDYEVSILPGSITVTIGSKSFNENIDIANSEEADGGDSLTFYRQEDSEEVYVQKT